MITIRLLLQPGRLAQPVDELGRPLATKTPGPVVGSAEPIRLLFLDGELHAVDPPGFDAAPALRLSIAQDWDPATTPLYVTNALARSGVGVYDLADPSGTYTAEAVAALGALPHLFCNWEIAAYGGDPEDEATWTSPLSIVQASLPLRNRSDSLAVPTTLPPVDLRGPAGPAATVAVGATATLEPGASATVENVGTESAAVLNFGIPGSIAWIGYRTTGGSDLWRVPRFGIYDVPVKNSQNGIAIEFLDVPAGSTPDIRAVKIRSNASAAKSIEWRPANKLADAFPTTIGPGETISVIVAAMSGSVVLLSQS